MVASRHISSSYTGASSVLLFFVGSLWTATPPTEDQETGERRDSSSYPALELCTFTASRGFRSSLRSTPDRHSQRCLALPLTRSCQRVTRPVRLSSRVELWMNPTVARFQMRPCRIFADNHNLDVRGSLSQSRNISTNLHKGTV